MDALTSPQGSIALAIAALLLVLGFRLARPERAREWVAVAAYGVALGAQVLGEHGLLPGATPRAGIALRVAGAALLIAGLVLAGTRSRARRRAAEGAATSHEPVTRAIDPVYAGLALVALGQLLRAPSLGGAVAVLGAIAIAGWVALTPPSATR